ncbi:N-acetylneuraminate synthase [Candidatus Woesearchaeota archaeon]|nr:N-acetylneuraminate synthase [Candidatus Woesearchaeota archaeon]MBT7555326.1 N-acetylneuraminate synthase [Candidatus Woesearchaeota archaeon]
MRTYFIAEIGINHNGDMDIAKRLIDIASAAGCDSVKFQKRNPDVCVPEDEKSKIRETPWGKMTYLDYKYKVEFGKEEYDEIDVYCKERKIDWSASPWDLDSLEFLMQYDIPYIKIPSAMLTNDELLIAARDTDKKVILSTGMSTREEIDHAVVLLKSKIVVEPYYEKAGNFVLLHCNSTYPAPIDELNLSAIKTLKERYNCEVGYSGHEFRLSTSVAATYLGASVIERHITLDRSMWGSDQLSSVEPQGLFKLMSGIRELELARGDGEIKVTESEKKVRKHLRG